MNVKKLKEIIKDLPDEMEVVVPASDHSYRDKVGASKVTAEYNKKSRHLGEYWDDGNMSPGSTKIEVLLVD